MNADDHEREGEGPAEPQREPRLSRRACRLSPRRRWMPCIPCHIFSILFFVLVLVVLWFALRR
jgi:hypothetical protein